jgi:hypothetical protein
MTLSSQRELYVYYLILSLGVYIFCIEFFSTLKYFVANVYISYLNDVLSPFGNIRCFSFVKEIYLDIFYCIDLSEHIH